MYSDFFAKALELQSQGKPFATATVVRVDKPTSGQPGDKAIVTLEGELFGWIGGSCARPTVISEAAEVFECDVDFHVLVPNREQSKKRCVRQSAKWFRWGLLRYVEVNQIHRRIHLAYTQRQ